METGRKQHGRGGRKLEAGRIRGGSGVEAGRKRRGSRSGWECVITFFASLIHANNRLSYDGFPR